MDEKNKEKLLKSLEYLRNALKAEEEMNIAIHKYNALYTKNTRLYRLDGILDQFRMIILDVKDGIEDELISITHNKIKNEDKES